MTSPFNLILLGDPGAGKATQGARLVKKYPYLREFDFGEWLRKLNTPAMRRKYKVKEVVEKGKPAPTKLAQAMFREVILTTPAKKGVFFNGNPKLLSEAKVVAKTFKASGRGNVLVVYLSIPQAEIMKRLLRRKAIEGRSDDDIHHLRNRMRYYRESLLPGVDYLKTQFAFRKVNGVGTEAEVFRRLTSAIEDFRVRPTHHSLPTTR